MSFRARLILAATYLLAAVVLALEIPLALNLERRAESEFQSGVLASAAILAARSSDLVAAANTGGAGRRRTLRRLGDLVGETTRGRDERVVVTDIGGRVLADSSGLAATGTAYATRARPEFAAALFQGRIDFRRRFSESVGDELLLVTVPVVDQERVVGAIRVSAPTGAVEESVRAAWLRLAAIGFAVVAAGVALAAVLARTFARPVDRLGNAASKIRRGELDARSPTEGP